MSHKTTIRNDSGESLKLDQVGIAISWLCERHGLPDGEVSILLTCDEEMRRLNHTFRRLDEATDVLTFPAPVSAEGQIGDIAISIDFARRQAAIRGVPIEDEVAMLAIHGGLHLAGFDDEEDDERVQMLQLMNEAAIANGIAPEPEWSSLPHGGTL